MGYINLYSIPPLLTLLGFVTLATFILVRWRSSRSNVYFLVICLFGVLLYLDILIAMNTTRPDFALFISRLDHLFLAYSIPIYICFFHRYLHIENRKWLERSAYVVAFILMCLSYSPYYIVSMQRHFFGYFAKAGPLYALFGIGGVATTVYALIVLYQRIRSEMKHSYRNRLVYVFAGFGCMGLLNSLNVLPIMGLSIYPPGNMSFLPLIVFGVGLFRHDLLDVGVLVRRSLGYSVVTAILTAIYAGLILLANRLLHDAGYSGTPLVPVALFFLIVFMAAPAKGRIRKTIDQTFDRQNFRFRETLKTTSRQIVSLLDIDEIAKRMTLTLTEVLSVQRCAFFLRRTSRPDFMGIAATGGSPKISFPASISREDRLVRHLETTRQAILFQDMVPLEIASGNDTFEPERSALKADIVLPLISHDRLNGFIALGEKCSGKLYSSEEIVILETLAGQTALAIDNAKAYRVIEDLNRTLEQRVEDRTRALEAALAEKERTQDLLIRSESLAALGQLVAGVAHELNNPLATVTSLLQTTAEELSLIHQDHELDDELLEDLEFADKELSRARSIVSSLLGLSRQTQTYTEMVDLNAVVGDALRILHNQNKNRQIEIVTRLEQDLPEIQGNFANLGQVVLNITQNAVHAIGGGKGRILLRTRWDSIENQIVFDCEDTGHGVSESLKKEIFNPFFTTKEVGKGTGLGLYICHEIVKKHGGSLILAHTSEQGTSFTVRLNRTVSPAASPPPYR